MTPRKDGATPAPAAHTPLQFENLTASEAPLLKIYYWECCDIENLNAKLSSDAAVVEHTMSLPNAHCNGHPMKVVFWLRQRTDATLRAQVKRIKNCDCEPQATRVTFNQYRRQYNCPHRPLVNIAPQTLQLPAGELVALQLTCNYYLYGQHRLSFQIIMSDGRQLVLHFVVDIGFAPEKCILTRELLPVDAKEFRRFVQPIWVRNPTLKARKFLFGSYEPGLKGINPILSVPGQSVWPLLVKYRPTDADNEFELVFQQRGVRAGVAIRGSATRGPGIAVRELAVPLLDLPCPDQPYVLYPNKLDVTMPQKHYHSELVCVHNFDPSKSREFRWQLYEVDTMFKVSCEPPQFRLKPQHSALCAVHIRSRCNPLHFTRIPVILEVHRIVRRAELESFDPDALWPEPSYRQHLAFQLNLKVLFEEGVDTEPPPPSPPDAQGVRITIFEQLFWEYLQASAHMGRDLPPHELQRDDLSHAELLALPPPPRRVTQTSFASPLECPPTRGRGRSVPQQQQQRQPQPEETPNKTDMLETMGQLLADVLREVSGKWTFIPPLIEDEVRGPRPAAATAAEDDQL